MRKGSVSLRDADLVQAEVARAAGYVVSTIINCNECAVGARGERRFGLVGDNKGALASRENRELIYRQCSYGISALVDDVDRTSWT